jgi:cytochrome c oxidase assembly protein subunit 15
MNVSVKKTVVLCIALTYLVILAGAVVRATGSGMGCPDWPKCFGQYIPPTDVSQLPANYKELFKVEGKEIADFNALHTWVEYLNRLLGVLLGFAVLGNMVITFFSRKEQRKGWYLAVFIFLLTLFQAWLGAKVVSSNLAPHKVSIHLAVACMILAALIIQYNLLAPAHTENPPSKSIIKAWYLFFFIFLLQFFAGMQVREMIELFRSSGQGFAILALASFFDKLFIFHQLLASGLLLFSVYLNYREWKSGSGHPSTYAITWILIAEAFVGGILKMFEVPAWAQPIHIFLACLLFGAAIRTITRFTSLKRA